MKEALQQKITEALGALQAEGQLPAGDLPTVALERPKDEHFGEYTSNIALILAKVVGKNPREIAELIAARVVSDELEKIEVAGPGHLNLYVSAEALGEIVKKVLKEGEQYGDSRLGHGIKVNNEFISANPTGPLSVGNARTGFLGDALSRVLRKTGHAVTSEYYVNDAGEQVVKLGHSVLKDSEAVYQGEYIEALNAKIKNQKSKISVTEAGQWAAKEILENHIKPAVEKMEVHFDAWTSEAGIVAQGYVEKALEIFKEKNVAYEQDGALWLRTTDFGDDKDRVLVKGDGGRTYFATDCGHILWYLEKKFDRLLETFGADHHGYTKRFEAAARALGFTGDIHFTLVQLVKVVQDGEEVRMSKRAGNVVTIDELLDRVGHDVARFFFLLYAPGTHMNFDLGLAEERSAKNPVFYVQYAHARLASILRKAETESLDPFAGDVRLLSHPKERELLRELLFFPELVETVAREYGVQKLPQYVIRLADKLHSFYDECRVIDPENRELSEARLGLIVAVKTVLGNALGLMGVSAPEKM